MKPWLLFLVALTAASLGRGPTAAAQDLQIGYSTYLGGGNDEAGFSVAVDSARGAYVTGYTMSADFPTANPYQPMIPEGEYGYDAFVFRLSSSGSALVYSTYLGGSGEDIAQDIALDAAGNAYVTGSTWSSDFPTLNAYQATFAEKSPPAVGPDSFVSKISPGGSSLVYSTYLGGGAWSLLRAAGKAVLVPNQAYGIAVSPGREATVVGATAATDFPVLNPYQGSRAGLTDAFAARLASSGSALVFSTYLGGEYIDTAHDVALDSLGRAYVAGFTESTGFPVKDAYQSALAGSYDAFVLRLSSSGSALDYSTYLGGLSDDIAMDVAAASDGQAFVVGETGSEDLPAVEAFQATRSGGIDAFASRFSSSGTGLLYSTFLGGMTDDRGLGIALDTAGRAHLCGYTKSPDFPTGDAYQASFAGGTGDGFVAALGSSGSALEFSSYLGASGDEAAYALALDADGAVYAAGATDSALFPVRNPFQSALAGCVDVFVARLAREEDKFLVLDSGDYDGDGTDDIAIFRPDAGLWSVRELTRAYFGAARDIPVCGDCDGDATTEISIFRPSASLWSVRDLTRFYFGASTDTPAPKDYDGDGATDAACFRSSAGLWAVRNLTRVFLGMAGDLPVPGDYGSAGAKEPAVFRPASGLWTALGVTRFYFGGSSDTPVPGDYDGNATWEGAIFRPSTGLWSVRGVTSCYFGGTLDRPIPAAYAGGDADAVGLFRESTGQWSVRNLTRVYFGSTGDIPVTR